MKVEFYEKPVKGGKKTEKQVFFRAQWSKTGVDRRATDKDKANYPAQWAEFEAPAAEEEPAAQ